MPLRLLKIIVKAQKLVLRGLAPSEPSKEALSFSGAGVSRGCRRSKRVKSFTQDRQTDWKEKNQVRCQEGGKLAEDEVGIEQVREQRESWQLA